MREVGLLDEGYWLYMEDLDWCQRFWHAGWKVFYEPAGVALHVKGGSSGGRRAAEQEIAFHRGMGRFYRRFDAPEHNPLLNAAVYAGIGAKLARQPGDHRDRRVQERVVLGGLEVSIEAPHPAVECRPGGRSTRRWSRP